MGSTSNLLKCIATKPTKNVFLDQIAWFFGPFHVLVFGSESRDNNLKGVTVDFGDVVRNSVEADFFSSTLSHLAIVDGPNTKFL